MSHKRKAMGILASFITVAAISSAHSDSNCYITGVKFCCDSLVPYSIYCAGIGYCPGEVYDDNNDPYVALVPPPTGHPGFPEPAFVTTPEDVDCSFHPGMCGVNGCLINYLVITEYECIDWTLPPSTRLCGSSEGPPG